MEELKTVLNCQTPGCPKSNIWQSLMILALCGMAVTLAAMGVANDSFREVIYIIAGCIAFIKMNWNQGQMMKQNEAVVQKAEVAATVAVETKKSLEKKIDEKATELKEVAIEARDAAGASVLATVEGNKLLSKVHDSTNGLAKKREDDAYEAGIAKGKSSPKPPIRERE